MRYLTQEDTPIVYKYYNKIIQLKPIKSIKTNIVTKQIKKNCIKENKLNNIYINMTYFDYNHE